MRRIFLQDYLDIVWLFNDSLVFKEKDHESAIDFRSSASQIAQNFCLYRPVQDSGKYT